MKLYYLAISNGNHVIRILETDDNTYTDITGQNFWGVCTFPNKLVAIARNDSTRLYFVYDITTYALLNSGTLSELNTSDPIWSIASVDNYLIYSENNVKTIMYTFNTNNNTFENYRTILNSRSNAQTYDGTYLILLELPSIIKFYSVTDESIELVKTYNFNNSIELFGIGVNGDYIFITSYTTRNVRRYKYKNNSVLLNELTDVTVVYTLDSDTWWGRLDIHITDQLASRYIYLLDGTIIKKFAISESIPPTFELPYVYTYDVGLIPQTVSTHILVSNPIPISEICFHKNTLIQTDQENIIISKLNPKVHTINNKKILAISKTIISEKTVTLIKENAFGENIPCCPMILSNRHCVLYKNELQTAESLIGIVDNIKSIENDGNIFYNILMENHEIIKVNNLDVETLHPDNLYAKFCMNNYTEDERCKKIMELNTYAKNNDYVKMWNLVENREQVVV